MNFIVIDDFYKKPKAVREIALSADYLGRDKLQEGRSGTETAKCFFTQSIVDRFEKLIGKKISFDPSKNTFGAFALQAKEDQKLNRVHIDTCDWTGLVYLNPGEQDGGGTCTYIHKKTGIEEVPPIEELQRMGFTNKEEFLKATVEVDGLSTEAWKVSCRAGMRFNRLILFKAGHLFHAAESYFGKQIDDSRITQLFMFNEVN